MTRVPMEGKVLNENQQVAAELQAQELHLVEAQAMETLAIRVAAAALRE